MRPSLLLLVTAVSLFACSAPSEEEDVGGEGSAVSTGASDAYVASAHVNVRQLPSTSGAIIAVIPSGSRVAASGEGQRNGFVGVTWAGNPGWAHASLLEAVGGAPQPPASQASQTGGEADSFPISASGRAQMNGVVEHAMRSHRGVSAGQCFNAVWGYLVYARLGYGKLRNWGDAPGMASGEARFFAEYFNVKANADRYGLQRLPIDNPYDAPRGAIVVVAAGSPGTRHPTAGDIAIAFDGTTRDHGPFINDGPRMGYGRREDFKRNGGRVLGIFVPK